MLPTGPDEEIAGSSPAAPREADAARFDAAIAAIDAANAEDPNVLVVDGVVRPKELAHAEAMTAWVLRLDPDADEAQLLAARAHHFRRWTYPRSAEPAGRKAYLRWRTEAKRRQAEAVGGLLASHGYGPELIDRVQGLVAKEGLGRGGLSEVDGRLPAVQTHEDALCLVFLTTQFDPVADQLGDDRMIDVLARTLAKMSENGRAEAFALPLDDRAAALVVEAVERSRGAVGEPGADAMDDPGESDAGGLDVLLATPVDPLAEGEFHDDPDLMGAAPVILVDSSPETDTDPGRAAGPSGPFDPLSGVAPPPPSSGVEPVSGDVGGGDADGGSLARREGPEHPEPAPHPVLPPRASSVRRAMLWGERPHPPPVMAPPPPHPLDAPGPSTMPGSGGVRPDRQPPPGSPETETAATPRPAGPAASSPDAGAEPPRHRRWFARKGGSESPADPPASPAPSTAVPASVPGAAHDPMPMAEPVELVVPAEPDLGAGRVDPWGLEVAVARLSAGARRAAAVPLGIVSTMLAEGEIVEALVQGEYQHHPAVAVLTSKRVLIVNERPWSPDVRVVPITSEVVVQGWQDDRRATLLVGHEGVGLVVSGIVDRPLARELAGRLRELVASFGGPPA
jgi:hypothetical protein